MKKVDDPRVSALVVWQPKQGGKVSHVAEATKTFPDARAKHFWDATGWTLDHFMPVLGIRVHAWDLYLIYGPDARWDGPEPPKPIFWMHQLWGVDNGPKLDSDAFADQVAATLASMPK